MNNWENILKATCVRCKKQYRGVGAEVPKVNGEYVYNLPYRKRQQIAREWKNLGLEGEPVPRVCRECAPKVTREALEREGMEVHPASWRHATKNVNVCDNCKKVWLRNHGTQMDTFPEMWVKLTNDNTICDYVKNEKGDTRRIQQKKLRGGKVIKSMEEILKAGKTYNRKTGQWDKKPERDTEIENRGGGGGGPNRGGGLPAPDDEDEEDAPYSKEGGMSEDRIETRYDRVMEDDAMVSMNDEYCCDLVKEALLEHITSPENILMTDENIKKVAKVIKDMNCQTINNLFESENMERRAATLFGVNLYEIEVEGMKLLDMIAEEWQECHAHGMNPTSDLGGKDLRPGEVGAGKITEGEMKPSERHREEHRDWRDALTSPKRGIPRRKKQSRDLN